MNKRNLLLIALVALASGSIPSFAKLALTDFGPFTLVFFRFLAATLVMYVFLPKNDLSIKKLLQLKWIAAIGALNPIFLFLALGHLPSNAVALFYAIIPGLSVGYLWIVRRERESLTQIFGFCIGIIGVAIISLQTIAAKTEGEPWLGIVFASVAVLGFFAYGIMSKEQQRSQNISGVALAFYFAVVTTVMSLPFALYETIARPWFSDVGIIPLAATLYLGFIGTGAQYLLYQKALSSMETAQANIFIYLQPLVALALAALLVGEAITWQLLIGGGIVLLGARLALSDSK